MFNLHMMALLVLLGSTIATFHAAKLILHFFILLFANDCWCFWLPLHTCCCFLGLEPALCPLLKYECITTFPQYLNVWRTVLCMKVRSIRNKSELASTEYKKFQPMSSPCHRPKGAYMWGLSMKGVFGSSPLL